MYNSQQLQQYFPELEAHLQVMGNRLTYSLASPAFWCEDGYETKRT